MAVKASSDALEAAVRALSRREHSTASLGERLARAGIPPSARAEVIATLLNTGYLDDERFALERARVRAARGGSDAAIRHELEAAGVERELVEHALAELEPEQDRALRVAVRLGGGVRAARALARKGFAQDSIERALPGAVAELP